MKNYTVKIMVDFTAPNIAAAQYILHARTEPDLNKGEKFTVPSRSLERIESFGCYGASVTFLNVQAVNSLAAGLLIGVKLAAGYAPGNDPNAFYFRSGEVTEVP